MSPTNFIEQIKNGNKNQFFSVLKKWVKTGNKIQKNGPGKGGEGEKLKIHENTV